MLNVVDEFTRECLAIRVGRQLKAAEVTDVLSDLFILRGIPGHVRSDCPCRAKHFAGPKPETLKRAFS